MLLLRYFISASILRGNWTQDKCHFAPLFHTTFLPPIFAINHTSLKPVFAIDPTIHMPTLLRGRQVLGEIGDNMSARAYPQAFHPGIVVDLVDFLGFDGI